MTTKIKSRRCKILHDEDAGDVLRISEQVEGKEPEVTYFQLLKNSAKRRTFRLVKLVHSDEEPACYDVDLGAQTCDCPWGTYAEGKPAQKKDGGEMPRLCRHLDALLALEEDGKL